MMFQQRRSVSTKLAVVLLTVASIAFTSSTSVAHAQDSALPPMDFSRVEEGNSLNLEVKSAFLMDAQTGQVLYRYRSDERIQPASLAKILTFEYMLEALEDQRLAMDDMAVVSERAWRLSLDSSVSRMFLEVGDQVPIRDLLYGLMVSSGNDAAVVLAEHMAGTEEAFVVELNELASELGLKNTVLKNSHGLEAEGQFTTAEDMAVLARHIVLEHPEGLEITSTKEFQYGIEYAQPNFNSLVFRDSRVTGLKTGHLSVSGYHVVATAEDENQSLIAVVMGAASDQARANEAYALLQYGFRQFDNVQVDWQKDVETKIPVFKGQAREVALTTPYPLFVTVSNESSEGLSVRQELSKPLVAPVNQGQVVGKLTVLMGDEPIKEVDLVAAQEVRRGGWWRVMVDSLRLFVATLFGA